MSGHLLRLRPVLATVLTVCSLGGLVTTAEAIVVQTSYRKVEGGTADFGSGSHSFGAPQGEGVVTLDYTYNAAGTNLIVTARGRGTVYWDAFRAGCTRVTIAFDRTFVPGNLATRVVDVCGPAATPTIS